MKDVRWQAVTAVVMLLTFVATIFGVSNNFVYRSTFEQFKESLNGYLAYTFTGFDKRLSRIEEKQDAILAEITAGKKARSMPRMQDGSRG